MIIIDEASIYNQKLHFKTAFQNCISRSRCTSCASYCCLMKTLQQATTDMQPRGHTGPARSLHRAPQPRTTPSSSNVTSNHNNNNLGSAPIGSTYGSQPPSLFSGGATAYPTPFPGGATAPGSHGTAGSVHSVGSVNSLGSTNTSVGGTHGAGGVGQTAVVVPRMTGQQPEAVTEDDADLFEAPVRQILAAEDMTKWTSSTTFFMLIEFVQQLNASVLSVSTKDTKKRYYNTKSSSNSGEEGKDKDIPPNPRIDAMVAALTTVRSWIAEIPPQASPQRFGNLAFRDFAARLRERTPALMELMFKSYTTITPGSNNESTNREIILKKAIVELAPYFEQSFGHSTRIDYGSGHELSFAVWLLCLWRLGFIVPTDFELLVNIVFDEYISLVRDLQRTYTLEPAGSHGVWGLDDFQFLPYVFGSSQLIRHGLIRPKAILNREILDVYAGDYMYLGCIAYINEVKNGPFFEHSPLLYDVSGVHSWTKVNGGMLKMWIAEVLCKFPVVQHIPFGTLLTLDPVDGLVQ